jgi:hypothetical protein
VLELPVFTGERDMLTAPLTANIFPSTDAPAPKTAPEFDITDPFILHLRQWLLPLCYQKPLKLQRRFLI